MKHSAIVVIGARVIINVSKRVASAVTVACTWLAFMRLILVGGGVCGLIVSNRMHNLQVYSVAFGFDPKNDMYSKIICMKYAKEVTKSLQKLPLMLQDASLDYKQWKNDANVFR